jgi:hypothetical protein
MLYSPFAYYLNTPTHFTPTTAAVIAPAPPPPANGCIAMHTPYSSLPNQFDSGFCTPKATTSSSTRHNDPRTPTDYISPPKARFSHAIDETPHRRSTPSKRKRFGGDPDSELRKRRRISRSLYWNDPRAIVLESDDDDDDNDNDNGNNNAGVRNAASATSAAVVVSRANTNGGVYSTVADTDDNDDDDNNNNNDDDAIAQVLSSSSSSSDDQVQIQPRLTAQSATARTAGWSSGTSTTAVARPVISRLDTRFAFSQPPASTAYADLDESAGDTDLVSDNDHGRPDFESMSIQDLRVWPTHRHGRTQLALRY